MRTPMPRRRRRRRRRPPSNSSFLYFYAKTLVALEKAANFEDSTFQIRNGRYEGGDRPRSNNIVSWYLTLTDISFIRNSQFTNKDILLVNCEFLMKLISVKVKYQLTILFERGRSPPSYRPFFIWNVESSKLAAFSRATRVLA